jgi:hypothetical protein
MQNFYGIEMQFCKGEEQKEQLDNTENKDRGSGQVKTVAPFAFDATRDHFGCQWALLSVPLVFPELHFQFHCLSSAWLEQDTSFAHLKEPVS